MDPTIAKKDIDKYAKRKIDVYQPQNIVFKTVLFGKDTKHALSLSCQMAYNDSTVPQN